MADGKVYNKNCRECGKAFTAKVNNAHFCSECAAIRKKKSDSKREIARSISANIHARISDLEKIVVGESYGNITVIDAVNELGADSLWLCECQECGHKFTMYGSQLLLKTLDVCPTCYNKSQHVDIHLSDEDLLSKTTDTIKTKAPFTRFGYIRTLNRINDKLLLCVCGCGTIFIASITDLMEKKIKSCGCVKETDIVGSVVDLDEMDSSISTFKVKSSTKLYFNTRSEHNTSRKGILCECNFCGSEFILPRKDVKNYSKHRVFKSCGYCYFSKNSEVKQRRNSELKRITELLEED